MPEPTKSAYQLECERTCEWCAKGCRRTYHVPARHAVQDELGEWSYPVCTAPTRDEFIERLSAENAALKKVDASTGRM